MDFDLLSDYLHNGSPSRGGRGILLSDLPRRLADEARATDDQWSGQGEFNSQVTITRATPSNQVGTVISKIESIFESIADCMLDEKKELVIELKSRYKPEPKPEADSDVVPAVSKKSMKITFPSKNPRGAWKFSEFEWPCLMKVLIRLQLHYYEYLSSLTKL